MTPVQLLCLVLVGVFGTAVALTRDPTRQTIVLSFQGLLLTILFIVLQAPDVALSQLAVGAVLLPLLFLIAIARARRSER